MNVFGFARGLGGRREVAPIIESGLQTEVARLSDVVARMDERVTQLVPMHVG
jgi:hypothetical protein